MFKKLLDKLDKLWYNITYKGEDKMIVVKNARFVTDNKTVRCTMDYYVLLNGVPENSPRVAIGEARCAPEDKFNFKVGMDFAYDRAYAKAVEIAVKMNRPEMRFVCVKSGDYFKSGTIYPVQYDDYGNLFVNDDEGVRRPTLYSHISHISKDTFLAFMEVNNMVKLED